MNYETFKQSIVDSLKKHFGKDVTVSLHTVIKNNDLSLDGLTIEEPSVNISPTVYLNYYYEDYRMGKDFSKIVDEIIPLTTIIFQMKIWIFLFSQITSKSNIRSSIN